MNGGNKTKDSSHPTQRGSCFMFTHPIWCRIFGDWCWGHCLAKQLFGEITHFQPSKNISKGTEEMSKGSDSQLVGRD